MSTRTAADLTGAASYETLTLQLVDASGDKTSLTFRIDPTRLDNSGLQSFVNELQLVTQASIYQAVVSQQWRGAINPANADSDQRSSVYDGINLLFRQSDFKSQTLRIPAPDTATMVVNTDDPLYSALEDVSDQFVAIAMPSGMVVETMAYTERSESNTRRRIATS